MENIDHCPTLHRTGCEVMVPTTAIVSSGSDERDFEGAGFDHSQGLIYPAYDAARNVTTDVNAILHLRTREGAGISQLKVGWGGRCALRRPVEKSGSLSL